MQLNAMIGVNAAVLSATLTRTYAVSVPMTKTALLRSAINWAIVNGSAVRSRGTVLLTSAMILSKQIQIMIHKIMVVIVQFATVVNKTVIALTILITFKAKKLLVK